MRLFFNILAISGSSMYAGVMLAIGVILGGYWTTLSAEDFPGSFANNGRFIGRAILVVLLPALLGLAGSLHVSWGEAYARTLWLSSVVCIAALLILTMVWFGPTIAQFAAGSFSIDRVSPKLDAWLMLQSLRIALAAVASVLCHRNKPRITP